MANRRIGRRQEKEERNQLLLGIAIFLLLILVGTGGGYWWWINQTYLDNRLCPKEGPIGHTVLLIDKTDPPSLIQKTALNQLLSEVAQRRTVNFKAPVGAEKPVRVGELLSIFVVGEDYKITPEPIFSRCNPGLGNDANVFLANPKKLEDIYRREFDDRLDEAKNQFFAVAPSKWSPIMEMIQLVAINGFKRSATSGSRRLIIVSDMLHNTHQYTFFKQQQDLESFSKLPYFQQIRTDLPQVSVDIRYLMYSPTLQTNSLTYFWEAYFKAMGGSLNSAKPL
jgi:hypothetical protein